MNIDSSTQSSFSNITMRVETPDGEMFVAVMESTDGKPIAIDISIGKAGSSLRAWTHTFGRLLTMVLEKGGTLHDILSEISGQTSDRARLTRNGINIRSGVDGVFFALMQYKREKFESTKKQLGIVDDFESEPRGPRLSPKQAKSS